MNQTPAAILILTSSILAYAATVAGQPPVTAGTSVLTPQTTAVEFLLGVGSLALGIWGVVSLIIASLADRDATGDANSRPDLWGLLDPRRVARPYGFGGIPAPPQAAAPAAAPVGGTPARAPQMATLDPSCGNELSPEVKAQLSMAAHLEGRDRSEIIEEAQWQAHNEERLGRAIETLDDRSKDIIAARWLSEKKSTLQELANRYGVSAERIRQLEKNAFAKLRRSMESAPA